MSGLRVLIIKPHRLGDVLQALPALRAIRLARPGAEIDMLVSRRYRPLLADAPDFLPGAATLLDAEDREGLIRRAAGGYDQIHNLCPAPAVNALAGLVPLRPGADPLRARSGTFTLDGQPARTVRLGPLALWIASAVMIRRLCLLNLADAFRLNALLPDPPGDLRGPPPLPSGPFLSTDPGDLPARFGLAPGARFACLQPGSADPFRRWPPDRYAALAARLARRGMRVLVLGSAEERPLVAAICAGAIAAGAPASSVTDASGLDLPDLRRLLSACPLLLTNDTGPMHLAAMLGTPTLSLFSGPSIPQDTGAWAEGARTLTARLPCLPCAKPEDCTISLACRDALTPDAVMELLEGRPISDPAVQGARAAFQHGVLTQFPVPGAGSGSGPGSSPLAAAWLRRFLPWLPPLTPAERRAARADPLRAEWERIVPLLVPLCPGERRSAAELLAL